MTEGPDGGERKVVVGVDGSAPSEKALRWGAHIAKMYGARLEAVIAWDYPAAVGWAAVPENWHPDQDNEQVLKDTVRAVFGDDPPAGMRTHVREGGAAKVLIEACDGAMVLVVGSRGHGGFAGLLLGSVSANVAEHAPCPVLIIHGDQPPPSPVSLGG
jgi:nucleotide-binding universal stress UspA family protein